MSEYYNTPATSSGLPKYYGNWDANNWIVAPTPNATFEITMAYTKQPGRSIWILERTCRYVTILRRILSKSFTIVLY
jgi:hypothetical protein